MKQDRRWLKTGEHPLINLLVLMSLVILAEQIEPDSGTNRIVDKDETQMISTQINYLQNKINYLINNDTGNFIKPDRENSKLNTFIKNRIHEIQHNLTDLYTAKEDVNIVKYRINLLEHELENLIKQVDNYFRENVQNDNKINNILTGMSSAFNALSERLAILEEPMRLKELDEALNKEDYSKLGDYIIINETKVVDIIRRHYLESFDVDIIIYYSGILSNITRRALILTTVFNVLKDRSSSLNYIGDRFMFICHNLKIMYKIEETVLKLLGTESDFYHVNSNIKNEIKTVLSAKFLELTEFKGKIERFYVSHGFKYSDNILINDTHLELTGFDESDTTILFKIGYFLADTNSHKMNCWFEATFDILNQTMMNYLLELNDASNKTSNIKNRLQTNELGQLLEGALLGKYYDVAAIIYNKIDDDNIIRNVCKNIYSEYHDINSLVRFSEILNNADQRFLIITSIYSEINQSISENICDMLTLIYHLEKSVEVISNIPMPIFDKTKQMIDTLKLSVSSNIKCDIERYLGSFKNIKFLIVNSTYNIFTIFSENGEYKLGKYEYYINGTNFGNKSEAKCYYRGGVSITSYTKWYQQNDAIILVNWIFFILLISKICRFSQFIEQ